MGAFARCSSSLLAAALALAGCVEDLPPLAGTTSLRVEITSPADLGSDENRLDDTARDIVASVTVLDIDGNVDTAFAGDIDFFVHHLGSLSPAHESGQTLRTVSVSGGSAEDIAIQLPRVFGPAFLWAEHTRGDAPTFATGTSDRLWFRDPWLSDVSTPEDESAIDALERSPLQNKQVVIHTSRYGDRGRMVVTGSYAQGYTVSDVQCADAAGTPPCVTGDYDHVFVFTFSRPEDQNRAPIRTGQVAAQVSGGVSEFNGLTEIGFPSTVVADSEPHPEMIPEPIVIQPGWLDTRIELERAEAALVAVENAVLCPLDDDFDTYGQWKLDVGKGCSNPFNIITKGQVAEFDPEAYVGQTMPRVVGTLRPVNIGSFNVWIIYPRDIDDITLP